eukprot:230226-Pelagomonas_calceolata.AAC.1
MGKQAYLRKGVGIPYNPGEAPAFNYLMWDPTIPSKTVVGVSRLEEPTQIQHLVSRAPLGAR